MEGGNTMSGKVYIIRGKELQMFTIGELAKRLDRQLQTLRKWEKLGIIPQATYRSATNRRLYTVRQIDAIVDCVFRYNIKQGQPISQDFKDEVAEVFKEATQNDFEEQTLSS